MHLPPGSAAPVVRTLLLNGALGVGKSSCLQAVTAVLGDAGVPWAVVELDSLTLSGPRPEDDPFGFAVALKNLAAVAAVYRAEGVERLAVGHVLTEREHVERVRAAVDDPAAPVVRLRARPAVVADRLRGRHATDAPWELDGFLAAHAAIERSLDAAAVDDLVIDTHDLTPIDTARRVAEAVRWG